MRQTATWRGIGKLREALSLSIATACVALGLGCGEAELIVQESTPVSMSVASHLPKNLVGAVEYLTAPRSYHLTVVVEQVGAVRRAGLARASVDLTAGGVIRAHSPVDIRAFAVIVQANSGSAMRDAGAANALPTVSYPTQMAAGTEARWYWTERIDVGADTVSALEVRTRIVYEVLQ